MHHRRPLHTTAMRLAMRYALFYAVLIALGFGALYWATSRYVELQLAASLIPEIHALQKVDREKGRARLEALLQAQSEIQGETHRYYLLLGPDAERKAGNLRAWPAGLEADGQVHTLWVEEDLISGIQADQDGYWPMIALTLDDGSRLLIAPQAAHEAEDLQEFALATMAGILILSSGLALVMGWRLGRTLLARIEPINVTAQKVTEGDLSRRVPITGQDDEFDELAGYLNSMLARIEGLLAGMRQVTDNVAHDLRRPLARMRNRIEVTLLEARDNAEYRQAMEETIQDTDELMRTFNALLEIAQAETGSFRGEWGPVDLSALLDEIGTLYRDLTEEQGRQLRLDIAPGLHVEGNRQLLAQAVSNLLDNAIKYTQAQGTIRLWAGREAGQTQIRISDDGPGIPQEQRAKVLQRFVRLDHARSTPGNGLGLSLVKAVVDLHGAMLELDDEHPGLRVTLRFA